MSLKTWVREWLGIDAPVDPVKLPNQNAMRREVIQALEAVFEGKDREWSPEDMYLRLSGLRPALEKMIERSADKAVYKNSVIAVNNYIGTEQWIDALIERINRKQIS